MQTLTIKKIKTHQAWDRYVLNHETSGYCHLFNWARVISETYHHPPFYLAAVKKTPGSREKICGILPLFRFKNIIGRSRFISIPFFDTAGILARDRETKDFLFRQGAELSRGRRVSGMELRQDLSLDVPNMELMGTRPEIFRAKVGLCLDLSGSQQTMLIRFKSKLRNQIQKGRKNGLKWKIGKRELLKPFYDVFSRNMRDLGSPVHSKSFFNSIFTHFYHHSFICAIFYRSTPVAASFMFRFKKRLANPWSSSIREFRHLNANMFLYWQMIRFACNLNMDIFEMGRSSKEGPTYRFKKQWGPLETQIFWYRWNLPGNRTSRAWETLTIEPWKKIPITMANLIGPFVRKHISL